MTTEIVTKRYGFTSYDIKGFVYKYRLINGQVKRDVTQRAVLYVNAIQYPLNNVLF